MNEPQLQYVKGNSGISMQTSKTGWSEIPANSCISLRRDQVAARQPGWVCVCSFGYTHGNAIPLLALLPLEEGVQGLEVL